MMSFSFRWALVVGALVGVGFSSIASAQPAQPPAIVVVSPVLETTVPLGASFIGSTDGARRTVVGSAVDGRVRDVYAEEGDEVTLGSNGEPPALVQLKIETIEREVDTAKAELENRQFLKEELESSHPDDLTLLKATLDEATASFALAQQRYDRTVILFERQGTVSREQYDEAVANLEIAKQRRISAEAELRRFEITNQLRIAQAQARVEAQMAEVAKLEDQLGKHTMRSPFSGVVVRQLAEMGDWVSRGQVVAEVVEMDPIEIRVFVPEEHLGSMLRFMNQIEATEQKVDVLVTFDALGTEKFDGWIHRVVPQADPRSRAFPVLIHVKNRRIGQRYALGTGMMAEAILPVGEPGTYRLVPKDAVVLGGAEPFIVLAESTESGLVARLVPVKLGTAIGSLLVVQGNVPAGSKVVVEGNERLRPGQPLQILSEKPVSLPPALQEGDENQPVVDNSSLPAPESDSARSNQ